MTQHELVTPCVRPEQANVESSLGWRNRSRKTAFATRLKPSAKRSGTLASRRLARRRLAAALERSSSNLRQACSKRGMSTSIGTGKETTRSRDRE
jgi:hypothetical protein